MNSPYAAPDTPIASSKRPRIASTKGAKSPAATSAAKVAAASSYASAQSVRGGDSSIDDHKENVSAGAADAPLAPPAATPSKNLFSPTLRTADGHHHPPHDHHHRLGHQQHHSHSHAGADSSDSAEMTSSQHPPAATAAVAAASAQVSIEPTRLEQCDNQSTDDDNSELEEEEEEEDEFNPYLFISSLPAHESVRVRGKSCLPPRRAVSTSAETTTLPTLVLDLDETLVHCTVEPIVKPDLIFPVTFNGCVYQVYVRKRPYLDYFLETVSKSFEVVVFTASQSVYADVLLDKLDPGRRFIQHRLFREACLLVQGNYLKDLTVINRDLKQSVLVDNSPHAYSYQNDNGIPIESWYDDDSDTELLKLIGFLKRLQGVADVRPIVREHFKTYQLVENARRGLPTSTSAPPF